MPFQVLASPEAFVRHFFDLNEPGNFDVRRFGKGEIAVKCTYRISNAQGKARTRFADSIVRLIGTAVQGE